MRIMILDSRVGSVKKDWYLFCKSFQLSVTLMSNFCFVVIHNLGRVESVNFPSPYEIRLQFLKITLMQERILQFSAIWLTFRILSCQSRYEQHTCESQWLSNSALSNRGLRTSHLAVWLNSLNHWCRIICMTSMIQWILKYGEPSHLCLQFSSALRHYVYT